MKLLSWSKKLAMDGITVEHHVTDGRHNGGGMWWCQLFFCVKGHECRKYKMQFLFIKLNIFCFHQGLIYPMSWCSSSHRRYFILTGDNAIGLNVWETAVALNPLMPIVANLRQTTSDLCLFYFFLSKLTYFYVSKMCFINNVDWIG